MKKVTLKNLQDKKGVEKIVAITAYDAIMAKIFDEEVDVILVGDSLNMSHNGAKDTLSISVDEMIYHTKAVSNATKHAFIIADMPFGSYFNEKEALNNAIRFYKETNCDALKLEISLSKPLSDIFTHSSKLNIIKRLIDEGIALMPHIGLTPQNVRAEGGYKIKGKQDHEFDEFLGLARELQGLGAFALLLEGMKREMAEVITRGVRIPTIGIGSGVDCDGQILVWSDAFGFFDEFCPKFVRKFLDGKNLMKEAIKEYARSIKDASFPNENESY